MIKKLIANSKKRMKKKVSKDISDITFDFRQIKDIRFKNWCLALSTMVKELWDLDIWEVDEILKKWSVNEKRLKDKYGYWRVGLLFPEGFKREQWFYNKKRKPYKKVIWRI